MIVMFLNPCFPKINQERGRDAKMGSKTWKLRKGLGWIIEHAFLGASIASDHMVTLVDLEKVLKETDAPYAPMTPEITKKAYEYMVKGKIGRVGRKELKVYDPDGKLLWDGLKENLESLLNCYEKGDVYSEKFRDAENEARWYLHATLASSIAASDEKLWKEFFKKIDEGMAPGRVLHEMMKGHGLFKDLTYYLDPETGGKVEKTPHTGVWKNPLSNKKSIEIYERNKVEWYKTIAKYIIPKIPVSLRKR